MLDVEKKRVLQHGQIFVSVTSVRQGFGSERPRFKWAVNATGVLLIEFTCGCDGQFPGCQLFLPPVIWNSPEDFTGALRVFSVAQK